MSTPGAGTRSSPLAVVRRAFDFGAGRPAESAAAAESDDEDSKDRSCRSKGKGERKGQERNTEHLIHRRAPDHRYRSPVTKLEGGRT